VALSKPLASREKGLQALFLLAVWVRHGISLAKCTEMAKTAAWQRKEGKNPNGGLNAKGRASAKKEGMNLKPPQPEGGSRRDSFCARMTGMKKKLTSEKTAKDPNSRINKSLRAWKC